jgi:hypothetical protein
MLSKLNLYQEKGSFIFKITDSLLAVCNAPKNWSGIYLIYFQINGNRELIYIGISGRKGADGEIRCRKDGLRGRFLSGKTDGILRKIAWPKRMVIQNIPELEIDWYVTYGIHNQDFPRDLEINLLRQYQSMYGRLPIWNKCIQIFSENIVTGRRNFNSSANGSADISECSQNDSLISGYKNFREFDSLEVRQRSRIIKYASQFV